VFQWATKQVLGDQPSDAKKQVLTDLLSLMDGNGWTPLHAATFFDRVDMVSAILNESESLANNKDAVSQRNLRNLKVKLILPFLLGYFVNA